MKYLLSSILLCCSFLMFSQEEQGIIKRKGYITNLSSEKQCKDWFKENILLLDPIEGVYSVRATMQGSNAYITYPPTEEIGTFIIYKQFDGQIVIQDSRFSIKRIGETNAYNVNIAWSDINFNDSKRIVLENGLRFILKYEIPSAQIKHDMGRKYIVGSRVTFHYDCVKEYPTASMLREAEEEMRKQAAEEQARIMEEKAKKAGWTGTGWALKDGYIVTNYHVIEDANTINIQGVQGDFSTKYKAKVIATDKFNDIAIIKIDDSNFTSFGNIPYSVKTSTSDVGEDIFVLGYPLTSTMGEEIKLSTGIISSKTGYQGDVSLYQISAPIQPGNSGGPLFDDDGNVIGIVSAKHQGAENVGYAIKASYLRNLMESTISNDVLPKTNKISTSKLSEKVKSIKDYVFYITCSSQVQ